MSDTSWIDRDEYPFASHYFQTPAGKLHYVDEGKGQTIVMLHGNPTWSFLYRNLIKHLSPQYRCIAPDHLGFGLSDKPTEWSYLPADHADNLAALIDHLGLKNITLVLQDWGGPIGLHYAINHPDNVARLIVMNTWAWPVNHDPHFLMFSMFMGGPIGRTLIRKRNFFAGTFMRAAFGDKNKLSKEAHEHYLRALPTADARKGCYTFPKQIVASTSWLKWIWNNVPLLRDKPALFVWGMEDVAFREKELKTWLRAFPQARIVRLLRVGHFVQEEAPEELAVAVEDFFARETTT